MHRGLPRSLFAACGLLAVLASLWSASPAAAAAEPSSTATVQLGPISAGDGFALYITEQGCGSAAPYFQLEYLKHGGNQGSDMLTHTFTGFAAKCSLQDNGLAATLSARLKGHLDIDVTISTSGGALARPGLPAGCGPPYGPEYTGTAKGTIGVALEAGALGHLNPSKTNAQIFSGAPQQCPATQQVNGRELTADVGSAVVDVSAPAHSAAALQVLLPDAAEPVPGVQDAVGLQVTGSGAYASTSTNNSAKVGAGAPFTSGSLSFSALAACAGDTAQNGTLSGTLTINDPVLGPLAIVGSQASEAFTGAGNARPGSCNGLQSEPVEPALLSTCSYTPSGCSVSGGSATVTLYDETDPGTQTISSESVNFGDGTPSEPITNYGTVTHTYGNSGVFDVTLTVTDDMGTTSTCTILVYIDT